LKKTPLKNLLAERAKKFWVNFYKYFRKICKIGGKTDKIWKSFDKNLNFFSNIGSNFEADFKDPYDYHKSVRKN